MINLSPIDEPDEFDVKARQPGNNWLAQNTDPGKRPPDKWSPFRRYLIDGQNGLCAYGAILCIPEAQVDHFLTEIRRCGVSKSYNGEYVRSRRVASVSGGSPICIMSGDQCDSSAVVVLLLPQERVVLVQHPLVRVAYT